MQKNIEEKDPMNEIISDKFIISKSRIDLSDVSIKLKNGLLSIYQKPLENVEKELIDLISKQELCITQMQFENKKFCDVLEDIELNNLFSIMEIYQKKLLNIKKEILSIHKRIFKMKKRALRFHQINQKEVSQ